MTGDELRAKLDTAVDALLRGLDEQERYRLLLALAARNKPKRTRGRPPRADQDLKVIAEIAFMVDILKQLGMPAKRASQWVFTLTASGSVMARATGGKFRNWRLGDLRVDEHRKRLARALRLERASDEQLWLKLLELLDRYYVPSTRAPWRYSAVTRRDFTKIRRRIS